MDGLRSIHGHGTTGVDPAPTGWVCSSIGIERGANALSIACNRLLRRAALGVIDGSEKVAR